MYQAKNSGITLIELLIAISLAFILVMGLIELYLTMQRSNQVQHELMLADHRARQVFRLFEHEIRSAGHVGCAKLSNNYQPKSLSHIYLTKETRLHGFDDALTVMHAGYPVMRLLHISPNKNEILIDRDLNLKAGQIIVIADCVHVELHVIKAVALQKLTQLVMLDDRLEYDYSSAAEVAKFECNHFSVKHSVLTLSDIQARQHHLIAGVNSVRFKYALSQENKFHLYQAEEVHDWGGVSGVLIDVVISASRLTQHWYDYVELPA